MIERDTQFDARLMRYLDGAMDGAELSAFDAELAGDAEKRDALVTAAMHGRLIASRLATQLPAAWGAADRTPIVEPDRPIGRIGKITAIAAAVAVVGALGAAYVMVSGGDGPDPAPARRPVAVMIEATDVAWNSEPIGGGEDVGAGLIDVSAGSVEVAMRGGATVRLTGPARATLVSADRVYLERGTLDARMEGGGFSVDVPGDVRVVDVGTAFTVEVGADGRATVRVSEGRVRIDRLIGGASGDPIVEMAIGDRAVVNAAAYGEAVRVVRDLAVVNGSFEDDGRNMTGGRLPRGWRSVIAERAGCEDHVSNGNFAAGVDGRFVGLANYRLTGDPKGAVSALVQDTGHRVEAGAVYELTVAVGQRLDQERGGVERMAWAISLVDADSGDVLATERGAVTEAGVMRDVTLAFTPAPGDAGRRLSIVLANPQDADAEVRPGQTNFDHVRLERVRPLEQEPTEPGPTPLKETPR